MRISDFSVQTRPERVTTESNWKRNGGLQQATGGFADNILCLLWTKYFELQNNCRKNILLLVLSLCSNVSTRRKTLTAVNIFSLRYKPGRSHSEVCGSSCHGVMPAVTTGCWWWNSAQPPPAVTLHCCCISHLTLIVSFLTRPSTPSGWLPGSAIFLSDWD